jgi:tRNA A-37 threonylcarbamoyl transferase component Bud32
LDSEHQGPDGVWADLTSENLVADGRYVLVRLIGRGGMARVYQAYDNALAQWRAIKLLSPRVAEEPWARRKFLSEARTMARLNHDHIVKIFDVGEERELPFMVMQLVDGGSMSGWLRTHGPMPPRLAVGVMLQVCAGLEAAHDAGVIHRDVKPHNILVARDGSCLLTDFGIARAAVPDGTQTRTGLVMGTVGFMSPEQLHDRADIDHRADIYSAGATLWALLTGMTPKDLFMAVEESPTPRVPQRLRSIIARATAYNPNSRYGSASDLAGDLQGAYRDLPADPAGTPSLHRPLPPLPAKLDPVLVAGTGPIDFRNASTSGRSATGGSMSGSHYSVAYTTMDYQLLLQAAQRDRLWDYFAQFQGDPTLHVERLLALAEATPAAERAAVSDGLVALAPMIRHSLDLFSHTQARRSLAPAAPRRSMVWPLAALGVTLLLGVVLGGMVLGAVWLAAEVARSEAGLGLVPEVASAEPAASPRSAPLDPAAVSTGEVGGPSLPEVAASRERTVAPDPAQDQDQDQDQDQVDVAAAAQAEPTPRRPEAPEPAVADDGVAAVEPVAVEPVAVEPVAVEPVAEPVAVEPVAVEPVVAPAAVARPAPAVAAKAPTMGLAAHKGVEPGALPAKLLFMGKRRFWPDGQRVVLVLPPPGSAEMSWLVAECGVPESVLRRILSQKAFQGAIDDPINAGSIQQAIGIVAKRPGAVTVSLSDVSSSVAHSAR